MADKYLYNNAGALTEKAAIATSAGVADAGKIVALDAAGKLASNMLPSGVGAEITALVVELDTLVAGDFVTITANGKCRKADASGRPAHGFVLTGYAIGATADVYSPSVANTALSGMTPGAKQYLGASGARTETVPSTATNILQILGTASSASSMVFSPSTPIVLA